MPRKDRSSAAAREAKAVFVCAECGNESPKWFGRCPHCSAWNSAREAPGQPRGLVPAQLRPRRRGARPVRRDRGDARGSLALRHRRAGPRPGRRPGAGLAGAGRRRSRHRQEHAHAAARGRARRDGTTRALRLGRGERGRRRCAPSGSRCGAATPSSGSTPRPISTRSLAEIERLNPSLVVIDSIQTLSRADLDGGAGERHAGARVRASAPPHWPRAGGCRSS